MFNVLILICALTASSAADVRYDIHPTNGEFVKTQRGCGPKTQDELFSRVLKFVPTLVVDTRNAMTLVVAGNEEPADEMIDGIGWWHFDGKQQTKTMVISLKAGQKATAKVISIAVIRRMDDLECSERWVGTVEVSRGK